MPIKLFLWPGRSKAISKLARGASHSSPKTACIADIRFAHQKNNYKQLALAILFLAGGGWKENRLCKKKPSPGVILKGLGGQ
jgi:hypothetical protein